MFTAVSLVGALSTQIREDMRYVEVDNVIPGPTGKYQSLRLPVRSPCGRKSRFMNAEEGTLVCLRGHLEVHPEYGILVAIEIEDYFRASSGKTHTDSSSF